MTTGVLALQGAFELHLRMLARLGDAAVEVRTPAELDSVDRLVIPGGESSVMAMMAERNGLTNLLWDRIAAGMPVLGTCAGAIMLASEVLDGKAGQTSLGALDMTVRRNAFGRQLDSFTTTIDLRLGTAAAGSAETPPDVVPIEAVFIRAPAIVRTGAAVEVLARLGDEAVMVRQGRLLATTFHPELSGDTTVHQLFLDL